MIRQRILMASLTLLFALIFTPFSSGHQDDRATAEDLKQQVTKLYQQGRYAEAIPLAQKAVDILEKALGPEHIDVANSLNNLALLYLSMGNYAKAEPLYQRALAIREKVLGPEHTEVAASLNNLAGLYRSSGNFANAEPLYQRALAIREKVLGPEHIDVATILNNQALLYVNMGDYAKAEPLYQRALAIYEKALGPEHPNVAASLNNLADLYQALNEYVKAETLYQRALAIREKALGPENLAVANSLNSLAGLYGALGEYTGAVPLYQRALAIIEKALGPEHLYIANILNNLAGLYHSLGDYTKAEALYQRALAIREKALGAEHTDVAASLNNLAALYRTMGDYGKIESLFQRALAIYEKALGPDHPIVATSLNNLAALYVDIGDYAKAEPLYQRSLAIREKALGPEHTDVAVSLNNLAGLYCYSGDYTRAEPLYQRSLAIIEKTLGPEHPNVATSLNNLSALYANTGDYARAEPLSQRALAISEKALGSEHLDVAICLNNLAQLYRSIGDYAKAEPLYQRALTIIEKALGPEHSYMASCLDNLALTYAGSDDFKKAHDIFLKAQPIEDKLIDQVMGFTSEDQKMKFLSAKRKSLYGFMSLVDQYLLSDPSARKDALDVWLRRKGIILETQKRFQEALVYSDDTEAVKTFQDLAEIRAMLSRLVFGGPGKEGTEAYKKRIDDLEAQKEKLEARLSQLSQAFAVQKKAAKANSDQVASALPENTILLEFARIEMYNFKGKGNEDRTLPSRYLAFLLYAGKESRVGMIDLGHASKIDETIAKFKGEMSNIKDIKSIKALESSRGLYDLVFAPVRTALGDVKEVFVSPDGNLNLIPFEVLQGPEGKYLIEDYTFNYLSAGRDVLGFGQVGGKGNKAMLMGDPDFDAGSKEDESAPGKLNVEDTMKITKRSTDMHGLHFTRLPGTREEVKAIQSLLGESRADIYTGNNALEEVLRQQKEPPGILHLATHGFFLNDLDLSNLGYGILDRGIHEVSIVPKTTRKKVKIENPLLRSGIALAGANNTLKLEDTEKSDGIVTAEKILGLRLRGTDMVVLSACETGLGEVNNGEGVFGLCRAFTQAGARSLVMSMWSVPDKETKELMVEFYKNIQSGKMNRCQALRQAELKQIKTVKERYGITNPFYWGAFVFMGEP
jgi:CHAT domain-containing protein/Tfp pilus assembly protein PilF